MQINDITGYLYSGQTQALVEQLTSSAKTAVDSTSESASASSFSSLLTKELSELSEVSELQQLSSVLNGSVLGSITDADSLKALSDDLLGTGSGREIISKLAEGHLNSIVLSDNNNDDDSNSITSSLTSSYEQTVDDSSNLQSILEEMAAIVNDLE